MYAFSDGSPGFELLAGIAVLALAFVLVSWRAVGRYCDGATASLASGLRRIGLFPASDVGIEVHRLDLLRIALAFLLLQRFYQDLIAQILAGNSASILWICLGAGLAGLLCVGLATPVAALLLGLLLNLIIDNYTFNPSLGSMVIAISLIPMIATPAGRSFSFDAILMRQNRALGQAIRSIYEFWGGASVDRIQVARFFSLLAYGAISIYSALKHFDSPTWTSGTTTAFILLSPVSNQQYWEIVQKLYEIQPQLFILFGFISTYGMIFWQLFLVPLVLLSYWTRVASIAWGVLFFGFSTYFLSIKTLGAYEYVLWALIFWNRWKIGLLQQRGLRVVYTGRYAALVRLVGAIDIFKAVEFLPRPVDLGRARDRGLSSVSSAGKVLAGYDTMCAIAGRVLLLLPVWPLLQFGRLLGLGKWLYAGLASGSPRAMAPAAESSRPAFGGAASGRAANTVLVAFAILLSAYAVRLPFGSAWTSGSLATVSRSLFGQAPLIMGMGPIDVFNELDLSVYRSSGTIFHQFASGEIKELKWLVYFRGEAQRNLLTQQARVLALQPLHCGKEYARTALSILDQTLPADHAYRDGTVFMDFVSLVGPTRSDFLRFRHAPLERSLICRVSGSLNNIKALSTHYYPAGLERLRGLGLGFEPTDKRLDLAERFPCAQEVARAAYWFDRAGGRSRDAADVAAMHLLFDASYRRPLSCMLAYQALSRRVDMEPVPDAAGAINGNCEADLVSAEAFLLALTDEPEAADLRKSLEDAKTAFVSGQTGACLMATAKVRDSYLDRFRDPSGAANGVQHHAGPPLPAE